MFNGMMDPELMRMAQEQMSRMSPAELARIQEQMMSNPELIRMASESMQKLRPEDFKKAAEQLKHTRPEEMADIGEKMAKASPEELASMKARIDAQMYYEINAAEMLKKQGNDLHSQGKYQNALEKYTRAKNNLEGIPTSKGRNLLLACSLNMMSCYLKTKQYEDCIQQGTEVLTYDANNVKALYRRGQAYKELGQLRDAVFDLRKAHEVSPEDETIAEVLRDAEERFIEEGGVHRSRGLVIEEITEEATILSNTPEYPSSELPSQELPSQETSEDKIFQTSKIGEVQSMSTNQLETLKNDPESIRSFQNFSHRADSETLTGINGGKVEGMSPEMLKTASDAVSNMLPEELQKMFQLASSFQAENTFIKNSPNFSSGPILSDLSPDMLKTAGDMVAKMSPEDLQKMFEMMSSLKKDGVTSSSADLHSNRGPIPSNVSPDMLKMATEMMGKMSSEDRKSMFEMASSLKGQERRAPSTSTSYSNSDGLRNSGNPVVDDSNSATPLSSCLNSSNVDVQEQMRNQMQDPAMRQMFTSMIKNMNPEMMANMSEQFGFKLSREDAEKAQQAMSSLSPDALDRMMKWADRVQRGVEGARKTKNWLLGQPGMILAMSMLLLAVIFHWLGFIGK